MLIFTGVYGFGEKPVYMFCAGFSYTPVFIYTGLFFERTYHKQYFLGACLWNSGRIWVGGKGVGRGLLMGR